MGYASEYASPTFVSDIAHAILTAAKTALSWDPNSPAYVSAGKPAADGCDQLVVWVDTLKLVRPRNSAGKGGGAFAENRQSLEPQGGLPAADFQVQLLRCGAPAPNAGVAVTAPAPADLDAFATAHLADGWQLYRGLLAAWQAGTLFGGFEHIPAAVVIGHADPYDTQGGVAGWTLAITCGLY